jgi:RNA polymerase subunit RPABC4/transcription elongation factor Spt4
MTDMLALWGPLSDWEEVTMLIVALAASYWAILWLSAVIWTYRDMRDRGSDSLSQAIAVLLVLVFNLPGLILYLILRPHETLAEAYVRNLETEAMLHEMNEQEVCYACQKHIRPDFAYCPNCRTRLQEACANCGKPINLNWAVCAYCGRERLAGALPIASRPAARRADVAAPQPAPSPGPAPLLSVTPLSPEGGPSTADAASSDVPRL